MVRDAGSSMVRIFHGSGFVEEARSQTHLQPVRLGGASSVPHPRALTVPDSSTVVPGQIFRRASRTSSHAWRGGSPGRGLSGLAATIVRCTFLAGAEPL